VKVVLLVLGLVALVLYETPDLVRNKLWRELATFAFAAGLAFTLALLMLFGVSIPNPIAWMDGAAEWILSLFNHG
jgi:hypothetical protein